MSDKPIKEYLNTDDIVQIVNTPTSEKRVVIQKKVGPIIKVNKGQPQHIVTNGAPTCRNLSTDSASNCCVNNNIQNIKFDNVQGGCFDKENLPEIENLDLLLDALCDVMIRFDTDPKHYLKDDYFSLIKTLSNSLIHLYLTDSLHEESIEKINTQLGLVDTKVFALQSDVDKLIENVNNIDETLEDHINDFNNPHRVTKSQIGLSNVDNTSDLEKPISNAAKQALDTKVDKEEGKGLSDQNFTQEEKDKLASLHNYDDTTLKAALEQEVSKLTTTDTNLAKSISDEQYRASGAEEALSQRIDATNQELSTIPSLIAAAKSEAIVAAAENTSAVANEVLSESKTYTDTKLKSLTGALIYKGKYEVLPDIENFDNGNVIIVGNKEYVLTVEDDSKFWVELGDESAWDQLGAADAALQAAKEYADSLSVNYDSIGSAAQALQDAKDYIDKRIVAQIIRY